MATFHPIDSERPEKRPIYVIVPTPDGLDFVGSDVTYSFSGAERCAEALRACSGVSSADCGARLTARLTGGRTSRSKPALVTTAPYTAILDRVGYAGWTATRRHSRFVSMTHDTGAAVALLPHCPHPPSALFGFLGWGSRYGMRLGGLGSMGSQLWRSTLVMPAILDGFRSPDGEADALGAEVARNAYFGARKEAPLPFSHDGATYWDMTSAYPAALGASPLALGMAEVAVDRRHAFPSDVQGVALARVGVDAPSPWSPLPARVSAHAYMFGHFPARLGAWTLADLSCARERGDYVYIERLWLPTQESAHIFGPGWLMLVREARGLPAEIRWWAKRALNACWGAFAIDTGAVDRVQWLDDAGMSPVSSSPAPTTTTKPSPLSDTLYVAAEVTARCRRRLWDDVLVDGDALYVDTDGVILPAGATPRREGSDLGAWTAREHMATVEIRAPGVYRFLRADDVGHDWRYVTSGTSDDPDAQRWLFEQHGRGVVHGAQSYGGDQVVLPPGSLADAIKGETVEVAAG